MRDQLDYFYEWEFVFGTLHLIPHASSQAAQYNLLRQERMMMDTVHVKLAVGNFFVSPFVRYQTFWDPSASLNHNCSQHGPTLIDSCY